MERIYVAHAKPNGWAQAEDADKAFEGMLALLPAPKKGERIRVDLFSFPADAGVEVVEVKSLEDRQAAIHAVRALSECGGGDVVTLLRAASDLDTAQVVLPAHQYEDGAVLEGKRDRP